MKVRAKAKGFFGTSREPGDEFEIPDAKALGKWMIPVVEEDQPLAGEPERRRGRPPKAKEEQGA